MIVIGQTVVIRMVGYIDPGTGSLVIQVIIAGIVGGLYWFKVSWGKVTEFFNRKVWHRK